jgi:hypothetical protein
MLKLRIVNGHEYLNTLKMMLHDNNIVINKTKNGKPFLLNNNNYFSVAHANNKTILVTSKRPIGIDMELIRDYDKSLLKYLNLPLMSNKKFFKEWTRREAYIKRNDLRLSDITNINYKLNKFKTFSFGKIIISICY